VCSSDLATIYYGVSATFYYRAWYHYNRYKKINDKSLLDEAKTDIAVATVTHLINIIDAYYFAYHRKPSGWDGNLLTNKPVNSPWGATIRSAILPGWGQVYNESYIKAGFYVATVGYVGYKIYWNKMKLDETGKAKYDDDRRRYNWYMGLTYLLMLADAHVDAHLFKFDEMVDLAILPIENNGLQLNLNITF